MARAVSEETRARMRQTALNRWTPEERKRASQRTRRFLAQNPAVAAERAEFMRTIVQPSSPVSRPVSTRQG